MIAPVIQPVPGKGNFFLEQLAKTGAGESYQLFGQIGLDHGPEWYHGKFTDIATTFTAPAYSRTVYVAGGEITTKSESGTSESGTSESGTSESGTSGSGT